MAYPKYRGLKLGPGNLNDKNLESEIFVEDRVPVNGTVGTIAWNVATNYNTGDAVTYNGLSYNSLILGNVGNQPDISPSEWKLVDGKDGDIWIQVPASGFPAGGSDGEIYIKVNTIWRPLAWSNPLTFDLVDGQLTPEVAFEYPAGILPFAVIEYTLKRGSGNSRKREGKFIILNDGSTDVTTHEFSEIGADLNCPLTISLNSGKVQCLYTSTLEGTSIQLRLTLRGW